MVLAYEDLGRGDPPLVFVHGLACHRGFWGPQVQHFASRNRVVLVDLRGHGDSSAPRQRYTIRSFADDLAWTVKELGIVAPIVVGHSLGGLVALELAATQPALLRAAALIDSVLVPGSERGGVVQQLVAGIRSGDGDRVIHDYYRALLGPYASAELTDWIMSEIRRTPAYVTSSVWEESQRDWDDSEALRRCRLPMLYLDAGTPNAELARTAELTAALVVGRTVGSGHFSQLEVPDQVNSMLDRFVSMVVEPLGTA